MELGTVKTKPGKIDTYTERVMKMTEIVSDTVDDIKTIKEALFGREGMTGAEKNPDKDVPTRPGSLGRLIDAIDTLDRTVLESRRACVSLLESLS